MLVKLNVEETKRIAKYHTSSSQLCHLHCFLSFFLVSPFLFFLSVFFISFSDRKPQLGYILSFLLSLRHQTHPPPPLSPKRKEKLSHKYLTTFNSSIWKKNYDYWYQDENYFLFTRTLGFGRERVYKTRTYSYSFNNQ